MEKSKSFTGGGFRSKFHRHKHDKKKAATMSGEEYSTRLAKKLQEQLRREREAFSQRDEMRKKQINALVAQLDMLGVEPAVRLDDSSNPAPTASVGLTRRSLDISMRRKKIPATNPMSPRDTAAEVEMDPADDDIDVFDRDEANLDVSDGSGKQSGKHKCNLSLSISLSSDDDDEDDELVHDSSAPDSASSSSPRHEMQQSSGTGSSGSGSNTADNSDCDHLPPVYIANRPKMVSSCSIPNMSSNRAETLGNEALQLRLHELESQMEEQDVLHEQEIDQLSAQLEDAKNLIAQYQSLLGESEVALQRVQTAVGLQSAIATEPKVLSLSHDELRAMTENEEVKTAVFELIKAVDRAQVENAGPTMHRLCTILHGLTTDAIVHH